MSDLSDKVHISRSAPPLASMDFAQLLAEGLAACQGLASDTWTDYNEHDPGVTILEQVCYAITDLGFRAAYPVADTLAEQSHKWQQKFSTLYPGKRILTCNALTILDYRKLIIDQALSAKWANFKNVWLQPVRNHQEGILGLYTMQVEVRDPSINSDTLVQQLRNAYLGHRNVAEDLEGQPAIMSLSPVVVSATVDIAPQADPNACMAAIVFNLQDMLVPFVAVQSVGSAMRQGQTPDQIYDGPPLKLGLIDDACLQPLRTSLALSEVSGAMLAASGVQGVNALQVQMNGASLSATSAMTVPSGQVPRLTPSVYGSLAGTAITLRCQGVTAQINWSVVERMVAQRLAALVDYAALAAPDPQEHSYNSARDATYKNIAEYFSIQRQLPAIYGVGSNGVMLAQPQSQADVTAGTQRVAQAKQLKAYLLFFEQTLSDCLAQMANSGRLFSIDPTLERSYFFQSLVHAHEGPPDMVEVLRGPRPQPAPPSPPSPPEVVRYVIHLSDRQDSDVLLFRSPEYATMREAIAIQMQMLEVGTRASNYRVRSLPAAQYQLLLDGPAGDVIGFGGQRFAQADQAQQAVAQLTAFMEALAQDKTLRARHLTIEERGNRGVRLIDAHGVVLLDANRLSAAGQERWISMLLQCGVHADRYVVQERRGDRWCLALRDVQGRTFASGEQDFASRQEAEQQIGTLVALVNSLCCDAGALARHLQRLPLAPVLPVPLQPGSGKADARVLHYLAGWDKAVCEFDPYPQRRNRFLNHLLARFCERFDDRMLAKLDPRPSGEHNAIDTDIVNWKNQFLALYATPSPVEPDLLDADRSLSDWLGGGRSRGAEKEYRSGPSSRIALLLGIGGDGTAGPAQFQYVDPTSDGAAAHAASLAALGPAFNFRSSDPALMQALLRHGTNPANYSIDGPGQDGLHRIRFRWPDSGEQSIVHSTTGKQAAEAAVAAMCAHLAAYPHEKGRIYSGESLHAVEHVLLRSPAASEHGADFYSHKVSVVLPDWPARFQNHAFRAFTWRTAVENFPSHVGLHVHWLNAPTMQQFLQLHGDWVDSQLSAPGAAHRPLTLSATGPHKALADFLFQLQEGNCQ